MLALKLPHSSGGRSCVGISFPYILPNFANTFTPCRPRLPSLLYPQVICAMDESVARVVQAVYIAADPSQDRALHTQALEYLASVQQNTSETWRLAMTLFIEADADGARKHPSQVRLWALRVLENFLDDRFVFYAMPCLLKQPFFVAFNNFILTAFNLPNVALLIIAS